jgi:hypothetical protein
MHLDKTFIKIDSLPFQYSHSFSKYLLSMHYVPDTVLRSENKERGKTEPKFSWTLGFSGGTLQTKDADEI